MTPTEPAAPDLEVIRDPARLALLLDPERRRLVAALMEAPDSAAGLARRLGESRQRLNYHLRVLEEGGLVELHEERPRRGVRERVMRVVARRFVVDPGALGELGATGPEAGDRFSATYLVALAARSIREVAALRERAESTGRRLATASLSAEVRLADPSDFRALVEEVSAAVGEIVARYHTEAGAGRTFRLVAATYPAPERRTPGEEDA